jgi:SpoVK/Ycf46/Vps4 family AAA+-type ATPase
MPDLSGTMRAGMEDAIARARKYEQAGDMANARKFYLKASMLAFEYAKASNIEKIRKQRIRKAEQLSAKAAAVTAPRPKIVPESKDDSDELSAHVSSLISKSDITLDKIAGLEEVKRDLATAYTLALARKPTNVKLKPVKSVLMYGPPGNGKTLLAAAVSASFDCTFFNVNTGDLLSSLYGKSAQLVKAIFSEAETRAPSVIFFDEIDALVPSRDGELSSADNRLVSSFLQGADGFASKSTKSLTLMVGATNKPWLIDDAMMSRFHRTIYVPLPDAAARNKIFELELMDNGIKSELSSKILAGLTEGCSGRDIAKVCRLAVAEALRDSNPDLVKKAMGGLDQIVNYQIKLDMVTEKHMKNALIKCKPARVDSMIQRYLDWQAEHGM